MKIAVRTICLGSGPFGSSQLERVLETCRDMGLDGVQMSPVELNPVDVSAKQRAAFRRKVEQMGMVITAVNAGPNLVDPSTIQQSLALVKSYMELSVDLGSGIVTGECKAKPPGLSDDEASSTLTSAAEALAAYGESTGACFAIEPGPTCFVSTPEGLLELCRRIDSPHFKVNYDPANVLRAGSDPAGGVRLLGHLIVHTHAKDARRYPDGTSREVRIGHGGVDFPRYLQALRDVGFEGFLTIEREHGEDRISDVREAKEYLSQLLASPTQA